MAIEKFSIIIDTNAIDNYHQDDEDKSTYNNFFFFNPKKTLFDIIKYIDDHKLQQHIQIVLPWLVTQELLNHQVKVYESSKTRLESLFKKFSDLPDFSISIGALEYRKHVEQMQNKFFSKYNIKIIDIPKRNIIHDLIDRVLSRKKPFYKGNGRSDSGFKDAVIWESILEFAGGNKNENILFLTNDNGFFEDSLLDEFKKVSKKKFILYKNPAEVKAFINDQYKLKEELSSVLKLLDQDFYIKLKNLLRKTFRSIIVGETKNEIVDFRIDNEIQNITYNSVEDTYLIETSVHVLYSDPLFEYQLLALGVGDPFNHNIIELKVTIKKVGDLIEIINVVDKDEILTSDKVLPRFYLSC